MISNLDFPNFEDDPVEDDGERFVRQIKDFQREMERKKEEWRRKVEKMEKKKIRWEWTNNKGDKFNGDYEGEIQNNKPHGLGKWKDHNGKNTVEGEWKDDQLNGKVIVNASDFRFEYEVKNGKLNGKCIVSRDEGRCE